MNSETGSASRVAGSAASAIRRSTLSCARCARSAFSHLSISTGIPSPRRLRWPIGYSIEPFSVELPSRSEEHTSELQSLMRISYAVSGLKNKKHQYTSTAPTKSPNIDHHISQHHHTTYLRP